MEAMKNKFKSRRGASILLALLFLLVCMMVGASVVMAAASNAGKLDSNKTEQQKYLTLSSAVNLLVDELEHVKYVGVYSHTLTPVYGTVSVPQLDGDGNPVLGPDGKPAYHDVPDTNNFIRYDHYYVRGSGDLTGSTWLGNVLPLRDNMDAIFARYFDESLIDENAYYGEDKLGGINANVPLLSPPPSYVLTFAVNADGNTYGGLADTVKITVEIKNNVSGFEDGTIVLNAVLMEKYKDAAGNEKLKETTYRMEAVLITEYVELTNQFRLATDRPAGPADASQSTEPITWKLDHIVKK